VKRARQVSGAFDASRVVSVLGALVLSAVAVACSSNGGTLQGTGGTSGGTASVSAGETAVTTRGCPRCHNSADGAFMAGQAAPLAGYSTGVELYGPNLTPDAETGVGDWSDNQLVLAIREGIDNESMNLCPQMQHYKTMGDDEANSIVAFLRTIPAVKNKAPGSICPPLKSKP
jgi:hypothetical protein